MSSFWDGATLTPSSPLWGGIEGGGSAALVVSRMKRRLPNHLRTGAKRPPPLTPPHKGEGDANVGASFSGIFQ